MYQNPDQTMKSISLSIIITVLTTLGVFGQGIVFSETNFSQMINTARQQNKIAFVEVYLNGCPHCAALAPVLQEKKVGDFWNPAFVSMKVEANSQLSKELQQAKGLTYPEFPLFFFFDGTGALIHQAAPGEMPTRAAFIEEVIKHGKEALSPTLRTSNYANRYAKGDRDLAFLINYGKYTVATKNDSQLTQINDEIAKLVKLPSDIESQVGFYILSRLINDFKNPMAQYFFTHLSKFKIHNTSEYPKAVQEAGEKIIYGTLYGKRANQLTAKEVVQMRQSMEKVGIPAKAAAQRTLLKELEAHFREKNTPAATARLNEYRKTGEMQFLDYSYLVRYFNEKATDNTYVPSLLTWSTDALKLVKPAQKNKKEVADLYLEQAKAYRRIGKKIEATKSAQEALKIAKAAQIDTQAYTQMLSKIK